MQLSISNFNLIDLRTFFKKYHYLIFWLILGLSMSLIFGFMIGDHQTSFVIFMAFGIYLGLVIQFVKLKWLRVVAWVGFKLKYSWLKGGISHLYISHFRENPEMGRVFRPDYEMTYDNLKTYNFDSNAEILYAMGIINSLKNNLK